MKELAKKTKTEINFNVQEQYFEIKGRSQQTCDDTSKIIESNLLPQLNTLVDENKFKGTFEDIESIASAPVTPATYSPISNSPSTSSLTSQTSPQIHRAVGRPLDIEAAVKNSDRKEGRFRGYYETESDGGDSDDDEYVETFKFAKNIADPNEVLIGPPVNNGRPAEYLRIIGNDTDTECCLIDRQIKIVGTSEEAVKEALERFKNLQTIYKRRKRSTIIVPCVHCPDEAAPPFGLYFCSLERYVHHQQYTNILNHPGKPLHVIIPSFKNNAGAFQKPAELIDAPRQPSVAMMQQRQQQQQQQQWAQRQQEQAKRQQQLSLEEQMRLASFQHKPVSFGNPDIGMAPDQSPLWGENKSFVVRPSEQSVLKQQQQQQQKFQQQQQHSPAPATPVDDFPALPTAPRVTTQKKGPARRVMRLTNQKASPAAASRQSSISHLQAVKEYNLFNIKSALEDGLNGVRGFKGDIKLSAKMGKIFWTKITPEIQKQIWNFQDLKDILVKEHGIQPHFNDLTTTSDDIIGRMSDILPSPYSRSAYFEIHAQARNQPVLPYQPVVMYMQQGVVEIKKVVTATNKVVEIDWVSLNRKFDFQLLLQTEQTARHDVKPYSTFIKKVSVSPVTRQITYENVPDFLEVEYILLKQTTKYRIHFPFVVEITRVEKLPLSAQKFGSYGIDKILGDTGKGQVWYDMEVYYSTYDEIFKSNNSLPAGKLASWTVEDIVGRDSSDALVEYIRCLLMIVEKYEETLKKSEQK
ncbi:hypothetical protein A0J61_09580 [Choanephora cucurbitarum]|uniref:DUF7905 domain-containing protein n=1 Tax=Choanephora cucurbitarum TaxID=101091 RepID=A0A1C7N022_9FUNG|nr:hypothetical protein A0J61_09580 [Choanephora cucurbitarum]